MEVIRNANGDVISRSRNLRGIHAYVGKNVIIKVLSIDQLTECSGGKLCILFENGASFECNWGSYSILRHHVRNWRNVQGAPLRVNGADAGIVDYWNPDLMESETPNPLPKLASIPAPTPD